MRKPIGLKFEEDDVQRWDEWAVAHGFTRTSLIETAVEALIEAGTVAATRVATPKAEPTTAAARPLRRAYLCLHQDKNMPPCNRRIFLTPDEPDHTPDCPQHGPMTHQANRPYSGVPVG